MNVIKYKSIVAIVSKTLIDCKQEFNQLDGTIILTPQITKFGLVISEQN
jgi:hypothetical protein